MNMLPRWTSHKVVSADKIIGLVSEKGATKIGPLVGLLLEHGGNVNLSPSFSARGEPSLGDYYVVYEDGYASWSPAKAFEDGYTRIAGPPAWVEGDPESGRPEEC